jgi:hypothetical protein
MPAAIRASGALGNPALSHTPARPRRSSVFVHHLATRSSPPKKIFNCGVTGSGDGRRSTLCRDHEVPRDGGGLTAAERARLIYRTHLYPGHGKHRHKGFTETDYARLLDAAHQQLAGPIVPVWDNLPTHTSRAMRQLIAARSWLTVFQLPAYAPELNPVEGVWSSLKRSLANLTKGTPS